MYMYVYILTVSLSSTGETEEAGQTNGDQNVSFWHLRPQGRIQFECVDLWLTTKAVQTRPRTADTDHNENTTVPSGVVQQDHHWTTQWPRSNEQKELPGSQHSRRGPAEHWLASKCHLPPLCSTQTTLLYTGPSWHSPRLSLGQEHAGLQHHH